MSPRESTEDRATVRRSDRAVDDERWIAELLQRAPLGFVATSVEGQPFVNSNLFVYDKDAHVIYFHTARKGRTRSNIEGVTPVCFTVAEMGRLLPADEALEFSVEYNSVVVFGKATLVEEQTAATSALQALLDKYFGHLTPGQDYWPPVPEELKRTSVFRIDIDSWSGKMKKVGEFPDAFTYPGPAAIAVGVAGGTLHGDGYELSTDRSRLDVDVIHRYLAEESYWAQGRTRETVVATIENSFCFGIYKDAEQVGFARVITDFAVHAYIADVFVLPAHRGRGLGKWLIRCILTHPDLREVGRWSLHTRDAHSLYAQFGFVPTEPGRHMGYRRHDS